MININTRKVTMALVLDNIVLVRYVRCMPIFGQIGTNVDKSGTFSNDPFSAPLDSSTQIVLKTDFNKSQNVHIFVTGL